MGPELVLHLCETGGYLEPYLDSSRPDCRVVAILISLWL